MITLRKPYLLFLGDVDHPMNAKTASGVAHWRPEDCAGQMRLPGCAADLGLPDLTVTEAAAKGAGTFVIGVAPVGGALPDDWIAICLAALEAGLDIASGLHTRIGLIPAVADAAARTGRRVLDVREPPPGLPCGTGYPRPGKRCLTVGTDCAVGKMFTALALDRAMKSRGHASDFRATGQTGILIEGSGIAVDAVVSDFLSGATEVLSPAAEPDHWDMIEGQGSLFHPSYAGVSLGLLHGAQADALVLCHQLGRTEIEGSGHLNPPIPAIADAIEANLRAARLTNPAVQMVGIAVNGSALDPAAADAEMAALAEAHGIPCIDPVRTGVAAIVERLERL